MGNTRVHSEIIRLRFDVTFNENEIWRFFFLNFIFRAFFQFECQLYGAVTPYLLIGRSSFLRRSIALDLSYKSAQKRAPTEQYRRRRRQKNIDHAKSAPKAPKKRIFATFFVKNILSHQLYRVITRDLLIRRSSFLRQSIALNLSYRSAQKRAWTEQYRRRRRQNIETP